VVRLVSAAPLLGLALVLPACAHRTAEPWPAEPFPAPMWRATHPGSPAIFDLLGSIHVRPKSPPPFQDVIDGAVDAADVLVLEADVDLSAIEAVGLVAWHGLSWRPLSTRISPARYRQLRRKLQALDLPSGTLDLFQPWLAAETLHAFELQAAGYSDDVGVDAVVRKRAEARGLPVRFLETVDAQLGLFSGLDAEIQREMLDEVITSTRTVADTDELVAAYDRGDLSGIEASLMESAEKRPAFIRVLLDERNAGFADGIEAMAKEDARILVVVGAAHFVGEQSVQALLRDRGFEVRRFTAEDARTLVETEAQPPAAAWINRGGRSFAVRPRTAASARAGWRLPKAWSTTEWKTRIETTSSSRSCGPACCFPPSALGAPRGCGRCARSCPGSGRRRLRRKEPDRRWGPG